jgi:NADH-quinone oxidoreductase subunit C
MPANYEIPLREKFGPEVIRTELFRDNKRVIVPADRLIDVLKSLKEQFGFDLLCDLAGIDYLGYPDAADRYAVVYAVTNTRTGDRLFVKTHVNDPDPELPSVVGLWRGAEWMEREVYDLFGVRFAGHPDLRRILMPEGFTEHPLRKDYPLRGRGERHNFVPLIRSEG